MPQHIHPREFNAGQKERQNDRKHERKLDGVCTDSTRRTLIPMVDRMRGSRHGDYLEIKIGSCRAISLNTWDRFTPLAAW